MAKKSSKKRESTMKESQKLNNEKKEQKNIKDKETLIKEAEEQQTATQQAEEEGQDENLQKITELQEKYIRLSAEFDNYRKRTLRERTELLKSAGSEILLKLLPVMDDFERAIQSMDDAKDIEAVKAGVNLIYSKFREFLNQQGVKEIEAQGEDFDTDVHEAITKIPAPEEDLKGKIVDVVEKGYYLNDKVIRYAKVVIGE